MNIGRRSVLAIGATAAATPWLPTATTAHSNGRLDEAGITELARLMAAGKISSEELTRYYLDRIDRIDRDGPALRSVIEVNPDAVELARRLDAEPRRRGPLHGLPVLIKDLFDTADRMHTTAG